MSDSSPTAYEDKPTRGAGCSNPPHEIEQNRPEGSSTEAMPWSSKEVDLLLKLRKVESQALQKEIYHHLLPALRKTPRRPKPNLGQRIIKTILI